MIELFGLAILAWMVAEGFEPLAHFKYYAHLDDPDIYTGISHWIVKAINCSLCVGFWSGLFYFQDPFKAAICSVLAEAISRGNKNTMTL